MVLPRASALASALPAPRAVLQFYRSMLHDLSSLVSLDGFIVRDPPSALPRASALARALLPGLLSSSSYWSMLDGLSIRSMVLLFESSRRCCLASPLSPEPRCHACCRPVPAGRSLAVSRSARYLTVLGAPVGAASRLRYRQSLACHACDRPVLLADVIRFESSRWCCLAPPLSPEPCLPFLLLLDGCSIHSMA